MKNLSRREILLTLAGDPNLLSEEKSRSIQETRYLLSIPAMGESIRQGLKIPVGRLSKKLGW